MFVLPTITHTLPPSPAATARSCTRLCGPPPSTCHRQRFTSAPQNASLTHLPVRPLLCKPQTITCHQHQSHGGAWVFIHSLAGLAHQLPHVCGHVCCEPQNVVVGLQRTVHCRGLPGAPASIMPCHLSRGPCSPSDHSFDSYAT